MSRLTDLPDSTRGRLAGLRASGTWGSSVSTDEFAAIRAAGFEPAGTVMGAAVFTQREDLYCCQTQPTGAWAHPPPWSEFYTRYSTFQRGRSAAYRAGVPDAVVRDRPSPAQLMYDARHVAIDRMQAECAALGGHGVVGASVQVSGHPVGEEAITVAGTAVRVPGAPPLERPFTCQLGGQDFAKLILAGWVPAGIVLGIATLARHERIEGMATTGRNGLSNYEIVDRSDLVTRTRRAAREQLGQDVSRLGTDGAVLSRMDLRVRRQPCGTLGGSDYIAEATIAGTAIARFGGPRPPAAAGSLAIMALDAERRQAVRARAPGLSRRDALRDAAASRPDGHRRGSIR